MKLPPMLVSAAEKFKALSLRERVLSIAAALAVLFILWDSVAMSPLERQRATLVLELAALQESIGAAAEAAEAKNASDPLNIAIAKQRELQAQLRAAEVRLASETAGLIEPRRMAEVIHAVLSRQHGVTLVSLRNLPAKSLSAQHSQKDASPATTQAPEAPAPATGPYLHPAELVVEGRYLDVLAYLRALEALPYRFYWRLLELQTTEYPVNRVRIELGTLSMDREWIGI